MSNKATSVCVCVCVRESSELSSNFAILHTFKMMLLIKSSLKSVFKHLEAAKPDYEEKERNRNDESVRS